VKNNKNSVIFPRALTLLPGGVNSPVRAFQAVGGEPVFIRRGEGAYLWDVDGKQYIDYVMSWGPLILGHCHPKVVEAVKTAAENGLSFGACTEAETELAELIIDRFPGAEMVRLVSSGTEACMTALRLARGYTKRDYIVKFDGCYHGHSDSLLVKAGSGAATMGIPGSAGVPEVLAKLTISLPYNDLDAVEKTFHRMGDDIACVIVEPVAANMGIVLPQDGFLEGLRHITGKYDALLIFDEVITGFRIAKGGACQVYDLEPDLICLGKILGGGMPIGGVAGKREIMQKLAPAGEVYQAGTLSGNPVSLAAGIATLKEIDRPGFYDELKVKTEKLAEGLLKAFTNANIPLTINHHTGLLTVFFGGHPVTDYASAQKCNMQKFAQFHRRMLSAGVYLPPSGYEAWFVGEGHSEEVLDRTVEIVQNIFGI